MSSTSYHYTAGQQVQNYTLLEPLGLGGFAEVWKARDNEYEGGRLVAIKLFDRDMMAIPTVLQMANKEANAQAKFEKSPLIVPIFQVHLKDTPHFLLMMLMNGGTLASRIGKGKGMPIAEVAPLFREIVKSLKVVHDKSLIHRDLKPSNILFEREAIHTASGTPGPAVDHGPLRMSDFGIVHDPDSEITTRFGFKLGTPPYMAPEQIVPEPDEHGKPKPITKAVDIYAAGVLLYEMLAGERPIEGTSTTEIMVNRELGKLTPISVRVPAIQKPVETVVMKCLAKTSKYRYQNCDELLAAFDRAMEPGTILEPPPPPPDRLQDREKPKGNALWMIALLLGAIGAGMLGWFLINPSVRKESVITSVVSKPGPPPPAPPVDEVCQKADWKTMPYNDPLLVPGRCKGEARDARFGYVDNLLKVTDWGEIGKDDSRLKDCAEFRPCEERVKIINNPLPPPPIIVPEKPPKPPRVVPTRVCESENDAYQLPPSCKTDSDPNFCMTCKRKFKIRDDTGIGVDKN